MTQPSSTAGFEQRIQHRITLCDQIERLGSCTLLESSEVCGSCRRCAEVGRLDEHETSKACPVSSIMPDSSEVCGSCRLYAEAKGVDQEYFQSTLPASSEVCGSCRHGALSLSDFDELSYPWQWQAKAESKAVADVISDASAGDNFGWPDSGLTGVCRPYSRPQAPLTGLAIGLDTQYSPINRISYTRCCRHRTTSDTTQTRRSSGSLLARRIQIGLYVSPPLLCCSLVAGFLWSLRSLCMAVSHDARDTHSLFRASNSGRSSRSILPTLIESGLDFSLSFPYPSSSLGDEKCGAILQVLSVP